MYPACNYRFPGPLAPSGWRPGESCRAPVSRPQFFSYRPSHEQAMRFGCARRVWWPSPGSSKQFYHRMRFREPSRLCAAGPTHVINWLIASQTDWLRSSSLFLPSPQSSARQISAQLSPISTYSSSLDSWGNISKKPIETVSESIYPNRSKKAAGSTKSGLSWRDARRTLGKIQSADGKIQSADGLIQFWDVIVLPCLSLGLGSHRKSQEEMVQHTDCAEEAKPTILITTCLVPTEGTALNAHMGLIDLSLPWLNTHNTLPVYWQRRRQGITPENWRAKVARGSITNLHRPDCQWKYNLKNSIINW